MKINIMNTIIKQRTIKVIGVSWFLILGSCIYAQQLDMLRPAPEGMFLYLAGDLAIGKKVDQYIIERLDEKKWVKVAEIKSPATWDEFNQRVELYKKDFPFSYLPEAKFLHQLWDKAFQAGTIDSMYMWSTSPIVRLASATAYYDKQVPKDKETGYRVTVASKDTKKPQVAESKPAKWPVFASFDSVKLEENNVEKKMFYLKWKSTGNMPAPNFKVLYYDNKQLKTAEGLRTIYKVKETTYYIYQDSIKQAFADRQFFMVPIDFLGNMGNSSQIIFVTTNIPLKRYFKTTKASTNKEMLGVNLTWHLSETRSIKSIDVYRSSSFDKGFEKINSCPAKDTLFIDLHVDPDKFYYYFLRANEMHGTNFIESSKFFDVGKDPLQPNVPVIDYAKKIPNGIELKISVSDINLAGVRIYRRQSYNENFIPVSDLIGLKSGSILWADTSEALIGNQSFVYVAKTENTSSVLSGYSKEAIGSSGRSNLPREVTRLKAYEENRKVNLNWDDLMTDNIAIKGYIVYRREKPNGKFEPVYTKDSISLSNMFVDSLAIPRKLYEYGVRTFDNFGGVSKNLSITGIQTSTVVVGAPDGLNVAVVDGKALLGWNAIASNDLQKVRLYRYQRGKKPILLTTLTIKESEYTDGTIKRGELYFYYITLLSEDSIESAPSKEVSIRY